MCGTVMRGAVVPLVSKATSRRKRARTAGRKVLPLLSELGAAFGKAARPVLCGGTGVARFLPPSRLATSAAKPSCLLPTGEVQVVLQVRLACASRTHQVRAREQPR